MLLTYPIFNKKLFLHLILLSVSLFLFSCSYIQPHRLDIQQGNIVEQKKVNQLKLGMSRDQVQFVLGTSMLVDVFHSNRWDYIHTMKNGHNKMEQKQLTLYFKDDKLIKIMGDMKPRVVNNDALNKNEHISVPLSKSEEDNSSWLNPLMWWKNDK
jgi:outer membrane protein assembly factor BamE (lipoprotein component of BamABCDE complex)